MHKQLTSRGMCTQVFTLESPTGQLGPAMTLKQFQLYTDRRATAGPPPGNPGSHSRSGNSDETLDSSMATGSAAPRLAAAPPALAAVPDKWLRRQLVLDALPLHSTSIARHISVRTRELRLQHAICCLILLCSPRYIGARAAQQQRVHLHGP